MKSPFWKTPGQLSRADAGPVGVSASMVKKWTSHKKQLSGVGSVGPSKPVSQPRRNIVGCRIQHGWKEGNGPVTQWKGTVLDQVTPKMNTWLSII
uniref:Uncharacterized protein n=1 Tax=Capra hircus TaxID=9925 RepID=A0A8C2XWE2_CAPHI